MGGSLKRTWPKSRQDRSLEAEEEEAAAQPQAGLSGPCRTGISGRPGLSGPQLNPDNPAHLDATDYGSSPCTPFMLPFIPLLPLARGWLYMPRPPLGNPRDDMR